MEKATEIMKSFELWIICEENNILQEVFGKKTFFKLGKNEIYRHLGGVFLGF